MTEKLVIVFLLSLPAWAQIYYRMDNYVQNALGETMSGTQVYEPAPVSACMTA